jgi:hypothetical protein
MYYTFVAVNIIEAEAMWFNDNHNGQGCVF